LVRSASPGPVEAACRRGGWVRRGAFGRAFSRGAWERERIDSFAGEWGLETALASDFYSARRPALCLEIKCRAPWWSFHWKVTFVVCNPSRMYYTGSVSTA